MAVLFGLPNLLSGQNLLKNAGTSLLSAAEGALFDFLSAQPVWGVFLPGSDTPAVAVDSVVETGVARESPVAEYRLESGSFASYNKVQTSFNSPLTLSKGGTEAERTAFLLWLKKSLNSTALFDIRWPEGAWRDVTLAGYRVGRQAHQGVTIIYAECHFKEIRQITALYYNSGKPSTDTTNAASPSDTPTTPTQRVQGVLASASQGVSSVINSANSALSGVQSSITGTINKAAASIRWS